jgi:SMI1 / KNR4 family (SUKH-1)
MIQDSEIIETLLCLKRSGELRADNPYFKGDFSPLSIGELYQVESQLGFQLPGLLRRIYTEIANGGFGYSYGFLGLLGGMLNEDGNDAVMQYLMYREPDPDDRYWCWTTGLLPIGHLGCGMYHCVQCDNNNAPIIWFEPNPHEENAPWNSSFIPFCPSLAEYLSAWLAGDDLFEKFLGQT